jgi:hypothetical protein
MAQFLEQRVHVSPASAFSLQLAQESALLIVDMAQRRSQFLD